MMYNQNLNIDDLINALIKKGATLWEENGKLKYKSPQGAIDNADLKVMKEYKLDILDALKNRKNELTIESNPENKYEPFPLTDIQSAYLLGRNDAFGYGGCPCHIYMEIIYSELNHELCEDIWNKLVERHDMLRAVINKNGYQRVLNTVPKLEVPYYDMSTLSSQETDKKLETIRDKMGISTYDTENWPLFSIAVSKTPDNAILHFSIEFLIADWASIWLLLCEFEDLYSNPEKSFDKLNLSFRDYLIAEKRLKGSITYSNDKEYWLKRIDSIPEAPDLPMVESKNLKEKVEFERHTVVMNKKEWDEFKQKSQSYGITPTVAIMTAYASVIERWSSNNKFCLNLTVLNRLPVHPQVNDIVGDFTTINLLEVDWKDESSFSKNAKKIGKQLFEDLDHRLFSGIEVLREISKKQGGNASLMPIVFTSAIGLIKSSESNQLKGKIGEHGISQTPQVFIDCQAMDSELGLQINWDVRKNVFPEGMIEDMFKAFKELLFLLTITENSWEREGIIEIPKWQKEEREEVNNTKLPLPSHLLHSGILKQIKSVPEKIAVIDGKEEVTYRELALRASGVMQKLKEIDCKKQDKVAVIMDKSIHQIEAVLGILSIGAVYVPIDTMQPVIRMNEMLKITETRCILTCSTVSINFPENIEVIYVDKITPHLENILIEDGNKDMPGYIIHTSGSTGIPKSVVITHEAAVNTIEDINRRFNVGSDDNILGLAQLSFDLSVYDIFGLLSVGGTLIYPSVDRQTDPSHWVDLILKHNITIWNSVPALMRMLSSYLDSEALIKLPKLRLAMLSGDWIPLELPDNLLKKITDLKIISLGGATEASIWSIFHEYKGLKENLNSIPYGKPLSNQSFYILDKKFRDCPVWVSGDIYISGLGLAKEYYGDIKITEERFICHPVNKERLYKTGDLGRYLPGGEMEFLGRKDNQVKIKGHRIELGEIETALQKHPAVHSAAVVTVGKEYNKSLFAVVEADYLHKETKKDLISDITQFIAGFLPNHMIPSDIEIVGSMPLTSNNKINRKEIIEWKNKAENVALDSENKFNLSDPLVVLLSQIWSEALGISGINETQNFYECGADSLIMAQVSGKLRENLSKEPYHMDLKFDVLLRQMINNPTIGQLAEFVKSKTNIEGSKVSESIDKNKASTNANLKFYNKQNNEMLRVVFHAGLGSMSCFKTLMPYLIKQNNGTVVGINVDDINLYCSFKEEEILEKIADDYAEQLIKTGYKDMQLIGYSLGGMIAVEVARRLVESDININDLILIDGHHIPFKVEDELILEALFVSNINLTLEQAGFNNVSHEALINGIAKVLKENGESIPLKASLSIGGDESLDKVGELFKKLSELTQRDRFISYAEAVEKYSGEQMPLEMIEGLFKVFCQSFKAANFNLMPYFGDIRLLLSCEAFPLFSNINEMTREFWKEICLGKLSIEEIKGNHFTCIEEETNAGSVAEIIGKPLIRE